VLSTSSLLVGVEAGRFLVAVVEQEVSGQARVIL
jgi:hypothetical protein